MKILGLNISRAATPTAAKALHTVNSSNRGWHRFMEPFTGAWQRNQEISLPDAELYWAVYSCISLIAQDIAKMKVYIAQKDADGVLREAPNHPQSRLINGRPNSYQNRIQFFEQWVLSKLRRGNTYVFKDGGKDAKTPRELHILHPDRTKVLVSDAGSVFYECEPDTLAGVSSGSERITIPSDRIIHDRMPALYHPLVGVTPIMAASLSAAHGLSMQQAAAKFFGNGSLPSGILSSPANIDTAATEGLRDEWNKKFGPNGTGGVAVLAGGLTYSPMSVSYADSTLLEQMQWTPVEVCAVFHVPGYKIGAGEPPRDGNAATLNQQYLDQCLLFHIESIELALTDALGLEDGYCVHFDTRSLLRMDPRGQMETNAIGTKAGIISPDEARNDLNKGKVEGGDTPYMQQQNYSLAALARRDAVQELSPEAAIANEVSASLAEGII